MSEADVIDFLRTRFARVDEALADIKADIAELKGRVGRLERTVADLHVQNAEHSIRMDRIGGDVTQIRRRLDLADAPAQ